MKIVINKCFGGFSISLEAARFMAARGNAQAIEEVAEYDGKIADPSKQSDFEKKYGVNFFGYGYSDNKNGYDRNDADLVAAVETLGESASGKLAELRVVEIPDDVEWEIDEYDGLESVAEKHRSWS